MTDRPRKPSPGTGWRRAAARWWYVVRYHRKSQLAARLMGLGRRRVLRLSGGRRYARPPQTLPGPRPGADVRRLLDWKLAVRRARDASAKARAVSRGEYCFLNQSRRLPDPVDWRLEGWPNAPHLWRFHLHYHEFLLDLLAAGLGDGDPAWAERAWRLVGQWIEHNPLRDPRVLADAWHPYCISRRLPVWVLLWSAAAPPEGMADRVAASLASQATFLEDHLERDLGGNHLLENARALVVAGAMLEGPDAGRWLGTGERVLREQLAEQILPHGEHFERAPMYHAQMLEAVLDVRDAASTLLPELGALCAETARRMAAFLREILHPDGELPLLGDSCLGEAPPAAGLIARAGVGEAEAAAEPVVAGGQAPPRPSPGARTVGDYWVYRQGNSFLLFDAGPVGPDHLPAHAHADLLGVEASVRGRRLIVDSGVSGYEDDPMRRHCRGTAAHNVLQIDRRDQCDMWAQFRMGYRGWPRGLASGETHGFHWARARHNAYRRLGVPVVGRWIACRPGGPWIVVDWAEGAAGHALSSRLHFHPEAELQQDAADGVRIRCGEARLRLRSLAPGTLKVTTGWYCPGFGRQLPCPLVTWTAHATLPSVCGWYLTWGEGGPPAFLGPFDGEHTLLRFEDDEGPVPFRPVGRP